MVFICNFFAELFFVLLRKLVSNFFRINSKKCELILLFITLVAGITSVVIARKTNPEEWIIVYLRSVMMIFSLKWDIFIGFIMKIYFKRLAMQNILLYYFSYKG